MSKEEENDLGKPVAQIGMVVFWPNPQNRQARGSYAGVKGKGEATSKSTDGMRLRNGKKLVPPPAKTADVKMDDYYLLLDRKHGILKPPDEDGKNQPGPT